ncbi:MAG: hypothetical protein WD002_13970 [Pseudomonadales bacterium]
MNGWRLIPAILTLLLISACDGTDPRPEETEADRTGQQVPERVDAPVIYEGLAELSGDASLAYLMPGVYANVFPLDFSGQRPANPLNVPREIASRLRQITPEIRMWSPPPGTSIAIERRGWHQGDVTSNGSCHIYFDYRVDVKEVSAGANGKFGVTTTPVRWATAFPPPAGQTGLYVLIVTEVSINVDRIGENFTETNASIVRERQAAGQSVSTTITRAFVVEHELAHAEQIRAGFLAALQTRIRADRLCDPTRPTAQHAARLIQTDFPQAWTALENSGAGGDHSNAQYPNTPVETEARRAAWRLMP